jgi:hypothetical protein
VFLIEFQRQNLKKVLVVNATRPVVWEIDYRDQNNRIEYSFDFKSGSLDVRPVADGKAKSHKVPLPPGTAAGESYAIQIDISSDRIIIREAQGKELDQYKRPNPAVSLGKFGFKGEVALRVKSGPER